MKARANRERMPETARIVDAWRAVFGKVIVRHAHEDGIEVGKRGPKGAPVSELGAQEGNR